MALLFFVINGIAFDSPCFLGHFNDAALLSQVAKRLAKSKWFMCTRAGTEKIRFSVSLFMYSVHSCNFSLEIKSGLN